MGPENERPLREELMRARHAKSLALAGVEVRDENYRTAGRSPSESAPQRRRTFVFL